MYERQQKENRAPYLINYCVNRLKTQTQNSSRNINNNIDLFIENDMQHYYGKTSISNNRKKIFIRNKDNVSWQDKYFSPS